MTQLILHLVGDYVTQSDWMAQNKTRALWPAFCHAALYSLPFLLIGTPLAVLVIFGSHLLIDCFRLARYLVWARNWLSPGYFPWSQCSKTGSHDSPGGGGFWLMIAMDNTLHLACNYCALRWL